MYSISTRFNAVFFYLGICLGLMSALNAVHTYYFVKHEVANASFSVEENYFFVYDRYIDQDSYAFRFNFKANLSGLFDWNTNLVFVFITMEFETKQSEYNKVTIWDQIIKRSDTKNYYIDLKNKLVEYPLTDIYKKLRGNKVKVYLNWDHMPLAGVNYQMRKYLGEIEAPKEYIYKNK